jgi:MFS family permease
LAIALARLFEGAPGFQDHTFHKADQQALCSLISFNLGAFVGRIGDRVGAHKRIWLIAGTFIQTLFTMASAIAFWKAGQPGISNARDDPAWTNALSFVGLAFMSASLGVQGILGKRLNTQFGTTSAYNIYITSLYSQICSCIDDRLG